ncbi:MAG: family transporter [Polaromonas sp.]|nr:family transporter [Polaromonas sp.]
MNRLIACGCLALSMALVGSYVALSKPLVAVFPVFLLAWLRFGIAGVAMLPWLKKPAAEAPLGRRTRQLLFLESFLGNFLFSICMLFGVSMTSAVAAGVIMAAIPAAVALMSWGFLRERISLRVWLSVGCAVLGIALVSLSKSELLAPVAIGLQPDPPPRMPWLGELLLVAAVMCEAAYAVIGKRLAGVLSARRITALINLWGLLLITPLGLWTAWHFEFAGIPASSWALLMFYALAASVWTVWLWMTGLKTIPASQAGVFTVLLPVSAAATGVLVLGERLDGTQLAAFGIALAGVVLATLPRNPSRQRPAAPGPHDRLH